MESGFILTTVPITWTWSPCARQTPAGRATASIMQRTETAALIVPPQVRYLDISADFSAKISLPPSSSASSERLLRLCHSILRHPRLSVEGLVQSHGCTPSLPLKMTITGHFLPSRLSANCYLRPRNLLVRANPRYIVNGRKRSGFS